jgi:endoglucanase
VRLGPTPGRSGPRVPVEQAMDLLGTRRNRRRRLVPAAVVVVAVLLVNALGIFTLDRRSSLWAGHWSASTWPAGPAIAGNPVSMTTGLYVDPKSQPATWVRTNPRDPRRDLIENGIASTPLGRWFVNAGDDRATAGAYVRAAERADRLPILVAYNIPLRDCGGHSTGGAASAEAYRTWVDGLVAAVGSRPAVVILEPDVLPGLDCRSPEQQEETFQLIGYAVDRFAAWAPNTWVYVDAGHSNWKDPPTMADRLRRAHIDKARGFSLNVSNYQATDKSIAYGQQISWLLDDGGIAARFVVDTSRNGTATAGSEWCNPPGQRVGNRPRPGGASGLDMQLWVKPPGEGDGACGIVPHGNAGEFTPSLAVTLLTGSARRGWSATVGKVTDLWSDPGVDRSRRPRPSAEPGAQPAQPDQPPPDQSVPDQPAHQGTRTGS